MTTDNINYLKFMKILIITTLSTLYMICSITSSNTQVVWKSDGTVIDEDGNVKKEGYGARFQKQLSNPTKEWPKASGNGQRGKRTWQLHHLAQWHNIIGECLVTI